MYVSYYTNFIIVSVNRGDAYYTQLYSSNDSKQFLKKRLKHETNNNKQNVNRFDKTTSGHNQSFTSKNNVWITPRNVCHGDTSV